MAEGFRTAVYAVSIGYIISTVRPSWRPLLRSGCLLRVYDLTLGHNGEAKTVAATDSYAALKSCLHGLPTRDPGTIRFYIEEGCKGEHEFISHLDKIDASREAKSLECRDRRGFGGLSSQWSALAEPKWWPVVSHELIVPESAEPKALYGVIGGADTFAEGLISCERWVRFAESHDKQLTIFISCETSRQKPRRSLTLSSDAFELQQQFESSKLSEYFNRFNTMVLEHLRGQQELLSRTQSPTLIKQILLLLLSGAHLQHLSGFLDSFDDIYVANREELSDLRRENLHKLILKENTIDSYYYGDFGNRVSDLVDTTRSLIGVIKTRLSDGEESRPIRCFVAEIEGHCSCMVNGMARRNGSLERRLNLFELSKNAKEQARNWFLSILASVFLPLSLATSILSMQTRFVNLHLLLYDLCGVIVLLATLVFVVLVFLSVLLYCREKLAKFEINHPFGPFLKRMALFLFFVFFVAAWMLAIASFLYGMIVDVKLGLKILGFGAVGVSGLC